MNMNSHHMTVRQTMLVTSQPSAMKTMTGHVNSTKTMIPASFLTFVAVGYGSDSGGLLVDTLLAGVLVGLGRLVETRLAALAASPIVVTDAD